MDDWRNRFGWRRSRVQYVTVPAKARPKRVDQIKKERSPEGAWRRKGTGHRATTAAPIRRLRRICTAGGVGLCRAKRSATLSRRAQGASQGLRKFRALRALRWVI